MIGKDFDKYREKIAECVRSSKFNYDLSGAAR